MPNKNELPGVSIKHLCSKYQCCSHRPWLVCTCLEYCRLLFLPSSASSIITSTSAHPPAAPSTSVASTLSLLQLETHPFAETLATPNEMLHTQPHTQTMTCCTPNTYDTLQSTTKTKRHVARRPRTTTHTCHTVSITLAGNTFQPVHEFKIL